MAMVTPVLSVIPHEIMATWLAILSDPVMSLSEHFLEALSISEVEHTSFFYIKSCLLNDLVGIFVRVHESYW
jgi:hypothetical protein